MHSNEISLRQSISPDDNLFSNLKTEDVSEKILNQSPTLTYYKVKGNQFSKWGIGNEDILLVESKLCSTGSHLCIMIINEESLIRRVKFLENKIYLMPESSDGRPFEIYEDEKIKVYGTIEYIIHKT